MRTRLTALVLLTALSLAAAAAPPERRAVFLRAGRAILEDGEISPVTIRIEGEWITGVTTEMEVPPGALVVDRPDAVVTPGFVDAHAWLDREADLAEPRRSSTPAFRAVDAGVPGKEALAAERASGVTLIHLSPSDANVVGGRAALRLADGSLLREESALKLALGGPALNAARYPASHWGALELLRGEGVVRDAEQARTPVLVRANGTDDLAAVLVLLRERPGLRALVVGGAAARDRAEAIAGAGAAVIWGPASLSASDRDLAVPAVLQAAGVPLAFGTDGRPGGLRRTAALAHRAGLPREATLHALTAGAADLLGVGEEVGRIREGHRADLAVWSGDPLDLSSRVTDLLVGGRAVTEEAE